MTKDDAFRRLVLNSSYQYIGKKVICVTYVIFEVKPEDLGKINNVVKDDIVSRQSILTRDASSLGFDKEVSYLKIEGSNDGLKKAEELAKEQGFNKLKSKKAEEINKKIQEQEDSAADGMGMIFG